MIREVCPRTCATCNGAGLFCIQITFFLAFNNSIFYYHSLFYKPLLVSIGHVYCRARNCLEITVYCVYVVVVVVLFAYTRL